jgi:hypothetical protein
LAGIWNNFAVKGMMVEIPNAFVHCKTNVYWVATIVTFAGYKALVKYETFEGIQPMVAWISFCSDVPKPIGYCFENDVLLFPPYGK